MTFPAAGVNAEYAAPNGITYQYKQDGKKWVVKEYGPGIDTSKFISVTEFNQDQLRQDNSITTLENKVSALEGSLFDGIWSFEQDDRIPRAGEFALRAGTDVVTNDWDAATQIVFNNRDATGVEYTFEKVTTGDVIRCGAADGTGAEYKVTSIISPGWFGVEHIRSTPDAADEVEYAFTFLSSFDPAGLATINYVDAQDDLKLNLTGGTLTNRLFFERSSDGANMVISPNAGDVNSSIYALNGGYIRFRSSLTEDLNNGTNTHITFGRNPDTNTPQTNIYHLQYPQEDNWAASKKYVDDEITGANNGFLALTGGDMTGDINMKNCRLDTFNAAGEQTMEISPGGFIKTRDMLRVIRTDNGPILEGRTSDSADDTTVKIGVSGDYQFNGIGDLRGDVRLRDNKRYIVRGGNNTNVGYFMATSDTICELSAYSGKTLNIKNLNAPSGDRDAATKIYVDSALAPFVTESDVQDAINSETIHLLKTGGRLTGTLQFQRGNKAGDQFKISPNSGDSDYATNIYTLNGGQMRIRTSHTNNESDHVGSHIVLDANSGTPETKIYHVVTPTSANMAANKSYVDSKSGGSVPHGTSTPTLSTGEMFFNTSNKVLYIGG